MHDSEANIRRWFESDRYRYILLLSNGTSRYHLYVNIYNQVNVFILILFNAEEEFKTNTNVNIPKNGVQRYITWCVRFSLT